MKTYICDACLKPISDPYETNMREFYIGSHVDEFGIWPCEAKCKRKIHICNDCLTEFKHFVRGKGLKAAQKDLEKIRPFIKND